MLSRGTPVAIDGTVVPSYTDVTAECGLVVCEHKPSNLLISLPLDLPIFEMGTFPYVGLCMHPTCLSFEDTARVEWKDKASNTVISRLYPNSIFLLELDSDYIYTGRFTLRSLTDSQVLQRTARKTTAAEFRALQNSLKGQTYPGHEFSGYLISIYYRTRKSGDRTSLVRDNNPQDTDEVKISALEAVTIERIRKERAEVRPLLFALIEIENMYVHIPCCCLKFLIGEEWL